MNSHFQSSDTAWIRTGFASECSSTLGSSSCEPIHATPARRITTMVGTDQTTSSICPEYSQSGRYAARVLDARYHHAKASVSTITGTATTNMMAVALRRINRSADDTGPCGSKTPAWQEARKMLDQQISCKRSLDIPSAATVRRYLSAACRCD